MRGRDQLLDLMRGWDARPSPLPYTEILQALRGLEIKSADLAEALAFDDRGYCRVAIRRRPHYEALVLCWKSGQSSPIHDHTGSSCVVRVVEGCATETRYTRSSCGRLVPLRSRPFPVGAVLGCRGDGIHQMANLESPGLNLVTLHVYSPPSFAWRFYRLEDTSLARHDRLIRDRPETAFVDLGHSVPAARRVEGFGRECHGSHDDL